MWNRETAGGKIRGINTMPMQNDRGGNSASGEPEIESGRLRDKRHGSPRHRQSRSEKYERLGSGGGSKTEKRKERHQRRRRPRLRDDATFARNGAMTHNISWV
jgi:hypothetical protein